VSKRTETMSVTEAQSRFEDVVERVCHDGTRVVVERDGRPLAAIVPLGTPEGEAGWRLTEVLGTGGEEGDRFADFMERVVQQRDARPPRTVAA